MFSNTSAQWHFEDDTCIILLAKIKIKRGLNLSENSINLAFAACEYGFAYNGRDSTLYLSSANIIPQMKLFFLSKAKTSYGTP